MHTPKKMAVTIICTLKYNIVPPLADLKASFMIVCLFIANTFFFFFKNVTFRHFLTATVEKGKYLFQNVP